MEVIKGTKRHLQVAMTQATPRGAQRFASISNAAYAGLKLPLLDGQILLNFYPVERPLQVTKVSTVK